MGDFQNKQRNFAESLSKFTKKYSVTSDSGFQP